MANTPYQYITPPSTFKPSQDDMQALASFLVSDEMAMTGDDLFGVPPNDNIEDALEIAAAREVFDDLTIDSSPRQKWLAFQLQKMINARQNEGFAELPFDDDMSRKAYDDALISYIDHEKYRLERENAWLSFNEWDPGQRELYEGLQKLLEHKQDTGKTGSDEVGGGSSMPDLNPPPVKDAKIGKGSMKPSSSSDMKELRDALPPGVSPGQSGYKSRYSG